MERANAALSKENKERDMEQRANSAKCEICSKQTQFFHLILMMFAEILILRG
jgi:hypothetical protein